MSSGRLIALARAIELGEPDEAGRRLSDITMFLLSRIPEDKRVNAIRKMIVKLRQISSEELASKNMKEYSSMGQSLTFIKNVLAGHDQNYIRRVLDAIIRNMVF